MALIVTNAFSINMLNSSMSLSFTKVTEKVAKMIFNNNPEFIWAVGHADTSALFAQILDSDSEPNRVTITFDGSPLLVGQYKGPRLPEGTTTLPEGATIEWWLVEWQPSSPL